jgi:hypothetical protein
MENQTKKRTRHPDRVTLKPLNLEKLDKWFGQIERSTQALRLTKSEFINWLIESHPEELSKAELTTLVKQFHDEVAFGEWALKQLRVRRASGEDVTLMDIMANQKKPNGTGNELKSKPFRRKRVLKDNTSFEITTETISSDLKNAAKPL